MVPVNEILNYTNRHLPLLKLATRFNKMTRGMIDVIYDEKAASKLVAGLNERSILTHT